MNREAGVVEPIPDGPLHDAGLRSDATVYSALWKASAGSLSPRAVDDLELWEIAVLLGHATEIEPPKDDDDSDPAAPPAEPGTSGRYAHLHARLAHARGEGPKPEAPFVDLDQAKLLMGSL